MNGEPDGPPSTGTFYAWWRGDPLPDLPELPGFAVTADPAPAAVTRLVATDDPGSVALLHLRQDVKAALDRKR